MWIIAPRNNPVPGGIRPVVPWRTGAICTRQQCVFQNGWQIMCVSSLHCFPFRVTHVHAHTVATEGYRCRSVWAMWGTPCLDHLLHNWIAAEVLASSLFYHYPSPLNTSCASGKAGEEHVWKCEIAYGFYPTYLNWGTSVTFPTYFTTLTAWYGNLNIRDKNHLSHI